MGEYSELLKDPRWQKKRLKIMERDNFQCQMCLNKNRTLTVHHKGYIKDKKPWEYPGKKLITLCESCHEELHMISKNRKSAFYIIPWYLGIPIIDFLILKNRLILMIKQQGSINSAIELVTSQIITEEEI